MFLYSFLLYFELDIYCYHWSRWPDQSDGYGLFSICDIRSLLHLKLFPHSLHWHCSLWHGHELSYVFLGLCTFEHCIALTTVVTYVGMFSLFVLSEIAGIVRPVVTLAALVSYMDMYCFLVLVQAKKCVKCIFT